MKPRVLHAISNFALSRQRSTKRWIVMLVDASLCALTCYVAVVLRLGFFPERDMPFGLFVSVSILLALPIFHALGLYREIFSQAGLPAILSIARACAIYTLPFAAIFTVVSVFGIPRTITLIQPILLFLAISASRLFAHYWLFDTSHHRRLPPRRVLIYGAGSAGRQLAAAIMQSTEMRVLGYLDDNPALAGNRLNGLAIHPPRLMSSLIERQEIDEILLAIPSASRQRNNEIVTDALRIGIKVRTLPRLMDIADGRVEVGQLREIEIEDLLGRASVEPDHALMSASISGRTVMVTGAGGSIGSELCRLIASLKPATLLLFEVNEHGLYEIHRELTRSRITDENEPEIIPLLGSVCDAERLEEVIARWRPDAIYHAAAYKHVPLIEMNAKEGVRTNILGSWNLANASVLYEVADLILVSTDKAVRPTSVMGATKRVAEMIFEALDEVSPETRFSMVRFGNVLGSSGSVVPLFREQIRSGGPVTLTDRRVTRYFMTIPEAAELVLQAGAMARGGDLFVLDMGRPVRICDLARKMIELAGLTVGDGKEREGAIEIVEIGLRPGEKLFEELLIDGDLSPTVHPRIMRSHEACIPIEKLREGIEYLAGSLEAGNSRRLMAGLHDLVPEFAGSQDHAESDLVVSAPDRDLPLPKIA